jgi:hypothetical protein
MRRCRLNGSDAQHCEDRSGVDPSSAAFFVSPVSPEILKPGSPLQRVHPVSVDRARGHADPPPRHGKAPVSRVEWMAPLYPVSLARIWGLGARPKKFTASASVVRPPPQSSTDNRYGATFFSDWAWSAQKEDMVSKRLGSPYRWPLTALRQE